MNADAYIEHNGVGSCTMMSGKCEGDCGGDSRNGWHFDVR